MPDFVIGDYLFIAQPYQLIPFSCIVVLAGIVRGCIGFGFSAIVVTSTSFWLPTTSVVTLVVMLEVVASIVMFRGARGDINVPFLFPLCAGLLVTNFLGVWLLVTLPSIAQRMIVGVYMVGIALSTLAGYQFKGKVSWKRIFAIGMLSGFFNGLSAVGGIAVAWGLVSSQSDVRNIRATMVVFFLISEAVFLTNAGFNQLITMSVIWTTMFAIVPLVVGVWIGIHFFHRFSEQALKKLVLVGLIVLSLLGMYKTLV